MVSSDDSFGWSETSDGTMSSSDNGNASQASSIQERKSHKKHLRKKLMKCDNSTASDLLDGMNDEMSADEGAISRSTLKRKKIKKEKKDAILEPDVETEKSEYIYERKESGSKEKKIKIKSESVETALDITSKKRKKKHRSISETDITDTSDVVKQEKELNNCKTSQRKSKNRNLILENEELDSDSGVHDVSSAEFLVKQEDDRKISTKKKKNKRKAPEESNEQDEEVHFHDDSFSAPPAPKKRKKHDKTNDISETIQVKIEHSERNGKSEDSTPKKHSKSGDKKRKNVSFSDDSFDLSQDKVKKLLRKDSVHFDDSTVADQVDINHKESSNLLEYERNGRSPFSRKHRSSSSNSSSSSRYSEGSLKSPVKKITETESINSPNGKEQKNNPLHNETRVSLSQRIQFEERQTEKPVTPHKAISRRRSSLSSDIDSLSECDKNKSSHSAAKTVTRGRISLSEKIRFEDDIEDALMSENDHRSPKKLTDKKTPMKLFLERNENLKPIKCNRALGAIDSDDEIWIVQCPRECEVNQLQGLQVDVQNKTKLKIEGRTYEGVVGDECHRIAVITPSAERNKFEIRNVKPNGTLRLRKRLPKVHVSEVATVPAQRDTFVPLPETKRRHPLFGHDYKKLLKLSAAAAAQLRDPGPPRKFKSKRSEARDEPDHLIQEHLSTKKKKKRKRKLSETEVSEVASKKLKQDPDGAEVWDSEKAIEKSLFNF